MPAEHRFKPFLYGALVGLCFVPTSLLVSILLVVTCGEQAFCNYLATSIGFTGNPFVLTLRLLGFQTMDEVASGTQAGIPTGMYIDTFNPLLIFGMNCAIVAMVFGLATIVIRSLYRIPRS